MMHLRSHVRSHVIVTAAALALLAGAFVTSAAPGASASRAPRHGGPPSHGPALFVSSIHGSTAPPPPHGHHGPPHPPMPPASQLGPAGTKGCATAAYPSISAAVTAASAGATIVVCPGVYHEDVVIPYGKPVSLIGIDHPIIDALDPMTHASLTNGIQVLASGTTVEGFTIAYAAGEGILVGVCEAPPAPVNGCASNPSLPLPSHVTIKDNLVVANDRGNPTGALVPDSTSTYAQCNETPPAPGSPAPPTPGDCGEGIHLLSAVDSVVEDNVITGNSGGILLTDENGPAAGNLIADNVVVGNAYDCGITLAGHHVGTMNAGRWSPVAANVAGVFDNTVRGNRASHNGVLGQGGGILLATGAPGGAVYDNLVEGNEAAGNGLAGVTVHSHSPGENLNGNVIRGNRIGTNNLDGDFDFAGNSPSAVDPATTGVIVANATGNNPITITIQGNTIAADQIGIWVTPLVSGALMPNSFQDVATPVVTAA